MVVLSVAVLTSGGADGRAGKTLVSRQFVEMTRLRVEALLGAFPKLVDSGRDHTFIETESVRYVYQPMEALYLVIITNKSSNILEDLETLRLFAKVVQDCCSVGVKNEDMVKKSAFDIIFAFDEVVAFGHRESVTFSQIKTYTEMDSHDERMHQMTEQSKINEAKEAAKKKSLEISEQGQGAKMNMPGIAGGVDTPGVCGDVPLTPAPEAMPQIANSAPAPWSGVMSMNDESTTNTLCPAAPKKGMKLSKKNPWDIMASLRVGASDPTPAADSVAEETRTQTAAPTVIPLLHPVKVDIEEKITANLQVEGGLQGEIECQGTLQVTVLDASKADLVAFKLAPQNQNQEYKYRFHPYLNKQSHANNILEVRDASFAFRANTPAPLIKWRLASTNEVFLPLTLSCWPSSTADGTQVVVELELTDTSITLEDIHIRFPAAPSARPQVQSQEPGEAAYDAGRSQVHWFIPLLDKDECNGTFEFSAAVDYASLMPFTLEAVRRGETKCPLEIQECYHMERKDAVTFQLNKSSQYLFTIGS